MCLNLNIVFYTINKYFLRLLNLKKVNDNLPFLVFRNAAFIIINTNSL